MVRDKFNADDDDLIIREKYNTLVQEVILFAG